MLATCVFAVCSLTTSSPAISAFERPRATTRSTCCSRGVKSSSPVGVGDRAVTEQSTRHDRRPEEDDEERDVAEADRLSGLDRRKRNRRHGDEAGCDEAPSASPSPGGVERDDEPDDEDPRLREPLHCRVVELDDGQAGEQWDEREAPTYEERRRKPERRQRRRLAAVHVRLERDLGD